MLPISLLLWAYCTYARPLLEYCTPVWSSHYSYFINEVESVQQIIYKAYEWIAGSDLKTVSYFDRLAKLGMIYLNDVDLTKTQSICATNCKITCVTHSLVIYLNRAGYVVTGGNVFKLVKLSINLNIIKYWYHNRDVDICIDVKNVFTFFILK